MTAPLTRPHTVYALTLTLTLTLTLCLWSAASGCQRDVDDHSLCAQEPRACEGFSRDTLSADTPQDAPPPDTLPTDTPDADATTSDTSTTSDSTTSTPCASQADCAPLAQLCSPQGACVSLEGGPCKLLAGNLQQPNILMIGSLLPTSTPEDTPLWTAGPPVERSVAMAVSELNQGGGLLSGRQLVHIGCDTAANPQAAKSAATYLIDTLGVAAIIGPALSAEYQPVCVQVASPKGALLLSASATSPALSALPDDGLCWRTAINDAVQLTGISVRISARPDTRAVRVFSTANAYGDAMRDSALSQPWAEGIRIDALSDPPDATDAALRAQVEQALSTDATPTDAVILTGGAIHLALIPLYDDAHAVAFPNAPPPRYWLTDSAYGDASSLGDALRDRPDLQARVEGVRPLLRLNTAPALGFEGRYLEAHGEAPSAFSGAGYDAVYAIALAASALDAEPVTGTALAAWLPLLGVPERPRVEVGPSQWVAAQIALAEAGALDLQGASGPLRFDPLTGDRAPSPTLLLWAPTVGADGALTLTDQMSFDGAVWRPLSP